MGVRTDKEEKTTDVTCVFMRTESQVLFTLRRVAEEQHTPKRRKGKRKSFIIKSLRNIKVKGQKRHCYKKEK